MNILSNITNDFIAIAHMTAIIDTLSNIGLEIEDNTSSPSYIGTHIYNATTSLTNNILEYINVKRDSIDADRIVDNILSLASKYNAGSIELTYVTQYIADQKEHFKAATNK